MPVKITHAAEAPLGEGLISADEWNDDHDVEGLGGAAELNVGTTAGTVAAGDHGHADATTGAAGFMSSSDKTKLDNIAPNATANQTDAHLLARANHTGTQGPDTIALTGPGLVGRSASGAGAAGLIDSPSALTGAVAGAAALTTAPSGASNWTPDWGSFINTSWVLTGNRTLNNPTNVVPGTTRTFRASASTATDRTISFGGNYVGDLNGGPVNNSNPILYTLYAHSTTEIWVSAMEDSS